ncbi:hypothetical protein F5883DRAFT_722859 [Diaporthe sp. PMI_573]|nr:hypothetical protein F5883DRAFT_722859 [Diaporthaceae sp. PMI_573]
MSDSQEVNSSAVSTEGFLTFLLDAGIKPTRCSSAVVLNECAARSTPRIFDMLVDMGADISAPGVYPFHQAAGAPQRGRIEMMEHLVCAHGFDPNGMDDTSLDTLHGADPHRTNQFGNTPFDEYALRLDADAFITAIFRTAALGLEAHHQRAYVVSDDGDLPQEEVVTLEVDEGGFN